MSHIVGTLQTIAPPLVIGPDAGTAPNPPGTWSLAFQHVPAPTGTKLLILHFTNVSLPASNRLEVELGYGGADTVDTFTSADGTDFWTRPVNVGAFGDGKVPIRYVTNGAATGSATLDSYGRGERHSGDQDAAALSNCDPFLLDPVYVEPIYDPFWFCSGPPNWEDENCVAPPGDWRLEVAKSVGMIIHVDKSEFLVPQIDILSTCSVTLIGPDLVVTAGHCMADPAEHVRSSSIIFNYAVDCGGARPAGYAGQFFKVKKVVAQHYAPGSDRMDYCVLQLATPPGLPAVQLRHDLPGAGEQVFGIHHPNGAVKKLSIPHPGLAQVVSSDVDDIRVPTNFHVSGGSSGSGLFDAAGRITGVLADGNPCPPGGSLLRFYPMASILQQIATPTEPPAVNREVMLVIDRSGSMSLAGASGRTKIDEARDAASLFVQLIRAGTGNKVGLVSFSSDTTVDLALVDVTPVNKDVLVGPAPFVGGKVGALVPGGATTIGGGLQAAGGQLPAAVIPRSILLLTDGLQNTPPLIADAGVQAAISGIGLDVIGYGTAASLDGNLLSALASAHGGRYVRADSSLQLEKFFAQAFGNIFEAGLLVDPEFVMAANQYAAAPVPFNVCEEEAITVVVGWDNLDTALVVGITTPSGSTIVAGAPLTQSESGRTWCFLRVPLSYNGERDGLWHVTVSRPGGGGEFPAPAPQTNYFVNVIASGGVALTRVPRPTRFFTGDTINPLVFLGYRGGGGSPDGATVRLTVTRPTTCAGNLLSQERLQPPATVGSDTVPARQATLQAIESRTGLPAIAYGEYEIPLLGGRSNTDGAFEPDGLYGASLADLLVVEGDYTFHVVATYGVGCIATRELQWTVHVEPSVDAARSTLTFDKTGTASDGSAIGRVTITPRDPYGNNVGPGRGDGLSITAGVGTIVNGSAVDNGDGTYTVPASWTASAGGPVVVITQPDRPPVIVVAGGGAVSPVDVGRRCRWICLALLLLLLLFILLWWFK